MSTAPKNEAWIDALLDDVAAQPGAEPDAAFLARVAHDAERLLPPPGGAVTQPFWRQVFDAVGGWGMFGGLAAATVTGLAVGLGALGDTALDPLAMLPDYGSYVSDGLSAYGWDPEDG